MMQSRKQAKMDYHVKLVSFARLQCVDVIKRVLHLIGLRAFSRSALFASLHVNYASIPVRVHCIIRRKDHTLHVAGCIRLFEFPFNRYNINEK
jgi:hypothetical protein